MNSVDKTKLSSTVFPPPPNAALQFLQKLPPLPWSSGMLRYNIQTIWLQDITGKQHYSHSLFIKVKKNQKSTNYGSLYLNCVKM